MWKVHEYLENKFAERGKDGVLRVRRAALRVLRRQGQSEDKLLLEGVKMLAFKGVKLPAL